MEHEDVLCVAPARAATYKHIHSCNLARAKANQQSLAEEMAEKVVQDRKQSGDPERYSAAVTFD